jgi:hypothetical protein
VSIREVAERMHPPRALFGNFPLGRPLGKPLDSDFQRAVLMQAFGLLDTEVPVLERFPVAIQSDPTEMVACAIPPRLEQWEHPAADEAAGLQVAHERAVTSTGRTSVGRAITAEQIPAVLEGIAKIVDGADWRDAVPQGKPAGISHDIRSYYLEVGVELAETPPGPWAVDRWFYRDTEAGRLLMQARDTLRDADAPFNVWFYLTPGSW